jgi:hypothetical protein
MTPAKTLEECLSRLTAICGIGVKGQKREPTNPNELCEFASSLRQRLNRHEALLAMTPLGTDILPTKDYTGDVRALWHLLTVIAGNSPCPLSQAGPYRIDQAEAAIDRVLDWCKQKRAALTSSSPTGHEAPNQVLSDQRPVAAAAAAQKKRRSNADQRQESKPLPKPEPYPAAPQNTRETPLYVEVLGGASAQASASPNSRGLLQTDQARARHSPDFRWVHWFGTDYTFTPGQAKIVEALWQAWQNGTPDMAQATLLEGAGLLTNRIVDLFKNNPAMRTMIVPGRRKGTFCLHPSE